MDPAEACRRVLLRSEGASHIARQYGWAPLHRPRFLPATSGYQGSPILRCCASLAPLRPLPRASGRSRDLAGATDLFPMRHPVVSRSVRCPRECLAFSSISSSINMWFWTPEECCSNTPPAQRRPLTKWRGILWFRGPNCGTAAAGYGSGMSRRNEVCRSSVNPDAAEDSTSYAPAKRANTRT
ncbi:hypothetical protein V1294_006286 [Bradyrhizobium sp. AZCC 1678]